MGWGITIGSGGDAPFSKLRFFVHSSQDSSEDK